MEAAHAEAEGTALPPQPSSMTPPTTAPLREASLASAALCSLPANDPLCQALLLSHARGGKQLVHTLKLGLRLSTEAAAALSPLPPDLLPISVLQSTVGSRRSGDLGPDGKHRLTEELAHGAWMARLLRGRVQTHNALSLTLSRVQAARATAQEAEVIGENADGEGQGAKKRALPAAGVAPLPDQKDDGFSIFG